LTFRRVWDWSYTKGGLIAKIVLPLPPFPANDTPK
jgi:hypothetical protein